MDIKDIEKHYERISDDEIIRIATTNAQGLRPEVFGIIENEIRKRHLDPNMLEGAWAQNKEYTIEEVETYAKLLQDLPCPFCGSTDQKLNGTILHEYRSHIFITTTKVGPIIACPDCLDKESREAILSTALLGWWSIPSGPFRTPVYIYRNFKAKKEHRLETPNSTLLSFALQHIGELETYKNDKEKLREIIAKK